MPNIPIYPASQIYPPFSVANSLRFNDGSSDYLSKTFSSASNQKTMTFSFWLKRSHLGTEFYFLYSAGADANNRDGIRFFNESLDVILQRNDTTYYRLRTNRLFRDVSAWYHIVVAFDTTSSTADDRIKIYVNGTEETSFQTRTNPTQNLDLYFNSTNSQTIGRYSQSSSSYYDGYMSEFCFIDGTALDPTSFGEFDEDTGVWKPIKVSTLTFGTNGFYLDFEDSSALGNDVSGNNNDFTVNNLTAIDQTTDTCTNNFATLLPLSTSSYITLSEGNLKPTGNNSSDNGNTRSSIMPSSGKWYVEVKVGTVSAANNPRYGIVNDVDAGRPLNGYGTSVGGANPSTAWQNNGDLLADSVDTGTNLSTYTTGDIIGIALDCNNGALYMSKNGTFENSGDPTSGSSKTGAIYTFTAGTGFAFGGSEYNSSTSEWNFGNPTFSISSGNSDGNGYGNFEYSVPSGYYALNSKNLAEYG